VPPDGPAAGKVPSAHGKTAQNDPGINDPALSCEGDLPSAEIGVQETGDGLQSVYLAALSDELGTLLLELIAAAGNIVSSNAGPPGTPAVQRDNVVSELEDRLESGIRGTAQLDGTEKAQLVKARRGQGRFRDNVLLIEKACRLTGIADVQFLVASHIKPWRVADNVERLDGANGLLLTPNIDRLFDRGFISFGDDGQLLVSPVADKPCLRKLGVPVDEPTNVGSFTPKQREYLSFHRRNVFLESGRER
jgi:hypothetical protein